MRNLITKVLAVGTAFTLAFALGIAAVKRQPASVCSITENRPSEHWLNGDEYVYLKGYLYGDKVLSFSDEKINACDYSGTAVVLADESKLSDESRNLIGELRRQTVIGRVRGSNDNDKFARAEVEIVGTLSEKTPYCFSSRYVITAAQITPTGALEIIDGAALTKESRER